jgi:hypothetical protein
MVLYDENNVRAGRFMPKLVAQECGRFAAAARFLRSAGLAQEARR